MAAHEGSGALFTQTAGKVRLALAPPEHHWWHATLHVSARGLTTGAVRHGRGAFEVELDLVEHGVEIRPAAGDRTRLALRDGVPR